MKLDTPMHKTAGTARYLFNKADDLNPGLPENVFNAVKTVGAALITGFFLEKLLTFIDQDVILPIAKKKYFETMLEENPKLTKEDPKEVASLWNTFYRSSPKMASDPVAAGAFVTQMIQRQMMQEYGGPTIDTYDTLTKIHKNQADAKAAKDGGKGINEAANQAANAIKATLGLAGEGMFGGV